MELRILRYFLTVAKEQSFTKAAEQLHITQPTLSRQIAALEEELGTVLFVRKGRSITLTDGGISVSYTHLIEERYGSYPEDKRQRCYELKAYFEEKMGRSLYDVIGIDEITLP